MARPKGSKDGPGVVHGPTRATRKGNGPGWGGAAKGASTAAKAEIAPPFVPGDQGGPGPAETAKSMARAERNELMLDVYEEIAFSRVEPPMARIAAAEKWQDRVIGKVPQRAEMTGKDGAPLIVVTGVPRADDD